MNPFYHIWHPRLLVYLLLQSHGEVHLGDNERISFNLSRRHFYCIFFISLQHRLPKVAIQGALGTIQDGRQALPVSILAHSTILSFCYLSNWSSWLPILNFQLFISACRMQSILLISDVLGEKGQRLPAIKEWLTMGASWGLEVMPV